MSTRQAWIALSVTLPALSVACLQPVPSQDAAFARATEAFLQAAYLQSPVWATEVGFHDADSQLDDLSEPARAARLEWLQRERRHFAGFAPDRLSRDDRIDREILLDHIDGEIFDLAEVRSWETNPLLYSQIAGNAIHLLLARDFAPLDVRLEAARQRLLLMPRLLEQARHNLAHPPRIHTETAMRQNRGVIDLVQGDLMRAASAGRPIEAGLRAAAESATAALEAHQRWLESDLLGRSTGDFRLGRKAFERKLRFTLESDLSSHDIERRAESERVRVRLEMYDLAAPLFKQLYPDSSLPADRSDAHLNNVIRPVLARIAERHARPSELLQVCRAAVDSLTRFVSASHLLTQDAAQTLRIEWTPVFSRGVSVAGLDAPGPLDRRMPAFYHVQPIPSDWLPEQAESFLREYNTYMIHILSMHEAIPGHFVQMYYSNRSPSLVRGVFANGAFVEGWAVYAERMVVDAGYMHDDPRLRLQQLKFYLRSVLNSIVDVGIHCEGMTEAQVVDLLTRQGFQEESEARGKWVRAQLSSTQLCTYFVGLQEILDLRAADRDRAGARWSLADFNERLLSHGSPPVRHLRTLLLEPDLDAPATGTPKASP